MKHEQTNRTQTFDMFRLKTNFVQVSSHAHVKNHNKVKSAADFNSSQ